MKTATVEISEYKPTPVERIGTRRLFEEAEELEEAYSINMEAIRKLVKIALAKIVNNFKSNVLEPGFVDDISWRFDFLEGNISVTGICLNVRKGIKISYSGSSGVVMKENRSQKTVEGLTSFSLQASIDDFEKFVRGSGANLEPIEDDAALEGLPLVQLAELVNSNNVYQDDVFNQICCRLSTFLAETFHMDYEDAFNAIMNGDVSFEDECVVIRRLAFIEEYEVLLQWGTLLMEFDTDEDGNIDHKFCLIKLSPAWIDNVTL